MKWNSTETVPPHDGKGLSKAVLVITDMGYLKIAKVVYEPSLSGELMPMRWIKEAGGRFEPHQIKAWLGIEKVPSSLLFGMPSENKRVAESTVGVECG